MAETAAQERPFVIGLHAGLVGRVARLLLGGSSVATGGLWLGHNLGLWWIVALAFAGALVFYSGVFRLIIWPPVANEPWLGTFVVLAPLAVISFAPVPPALQTGVFGYIGVSLIVNAIVGYGGCEAVVAPALIFRRRPTVYCPYNAIDAVERSLHDHGGQGRLAWFAGSVLAVIVGAYFIFVGPLLGQLGVSVGDYGPAASLLVLPAAALGWRAWRRFQKQRTLDTETRAAGLGTLALLAMAIAFAGLVPQDVLWELLMLGGLAYAIVRLFRRRVSSRS